VSSTQLGGNLFGHRRLGSDHLAAYLPDVSGHAVGLSLLAVSAANLLSAGSLPDTAFRGPGAVVGRPDDVFQMELQSGKYFTTFYGAYNRGARTLAYGNAAHPTWPAPAASGWGHGAGHAAAGRVGRLDLLQAGGHP
jgi:sigma-B regulation protein RsbU (phosphoserine phosphatase)